MAASGGTWVKGKFIPAKQTMAVMFNKQRQTSTKEEKNATVIASLDDVRNNLNSIKKEDLKKLRDELNIILGNNEGVNQELANKKVLLAKKGKIVEAYGPDPRARYALQYEVVEADSLIPSNNTNGTINNNYPSELQPRDRTRTASKQQIQIVVCRLLIKKQKQNTKNGNPPPSIREKFKFILTKTIINLQIKRKLKQWKN